MVYFILNLKDKVDKVKLLLTNRLNRKNISPNILSINTGDVLALVLWKKALIYKFEGICLKIKKKSLTNLNTSVCLRNMFNKCGIEVISSYYLNRIFFMIILDYKRKHFMYRKSKLYYLRLKSNRLTKVKI